MSAAAVIVVLLAGPDVVVSKPDVPGSVPSATNKPLADLLRQINVNPDDVKHVGISHFHADHTVVDKQVHIGHVDVTTTSGGRTFHVLMDQILDGSTTTGSCRITGYVLPIS